MCQTPMSKFMTKNGDNLLRFALFNQGIVDHNVFLPRQTEKVGIAMRTSFASVNDIQRLQRKLEPLRQCLHA